MKAHHTLRNAVITASALLVAGEAAANPAFANIPGARANAMGGAYIAIANDTTSLFYNPAGMASVQGNEIMIEVGDIVEQDLDSLSRWLPSHLDDPVTTSTELKFIGGVTGFEAAGINWKVGATYAPELYKVPSQIFGFFEESAGNNFESIKFETTVEQLSVGLGAEFGSFYLGATVDYQQYSTEIVYTEVGRRLERSPIEGIEGEVGIVPQECVDGGAFCPAVGDEYADFDSLGFTFGALYNKRFGEDERSAFTLGWVWRYNDADSNEEADDLQDFEGVVFTVPVAPNSWGLGSSLELPVGESMQILFSAQYEELDYGEVNDDYDNDDPNDGTGQFRNSVESQFSRVSAGAELTYLAGNGWNWFFRLGAYTAEDDNFADERLEYAGVDSITGGVGVFVPKIGKLEFTFEDRTIENNPEIEGFPGRDEYQLDLFSVSYSYVW